MRDRLIELIYCSGRNYDDYVDEQHEMGMPPHEDFDSWLADDLLANGVTVQEWISVDERLPEDGKNVLCFESGKLFIAFREDFESERVFWDWVAYDRDDTWNEVCPTHWMPLPPAPKGE